MDDFPNLDPTHHKGLFHVTDRLRNLTNNPKGLTWEDYKDVLTELCASLTISFEHNLEAALRYPAVLRNDPEILQKSREILTDLNQFTSFIHLEEEILLQCGLERETTADISRHVDALREHLSLEDYDPDHVVQTAKAFHNTICAAAHNVDDKLQLKQAEIAAAKQKLNTYGYALAIANASAFALTSGASAPVSLPSGAFATLMIVGDKFFDDPAKKKPGQ